MEYARLNYLEKLKLRECNGLIKVITGIRRCGKSYLLGTIFKRYLLNKGVPSDHIIEIDFDGFENERFREASYFFNFAKAKIVDGERYYFLLDEIQLLEKFESVLNSLLRIENVDLYVTGSNARFLSNDVITEFRGRGDEIHIWPLSFSEYFEHNDKSREVAWQEYLTYGGLPIVVNQPTHEQKLTMLQRLLKETYFSDILNRYHIRKSNDFDDLFNVLASNIGSLVSLSKLSNIFKTLKKKTLSPITIARYLSFFEDSFLIESSQRYNIKGNAYFESQKKYYFSDLGLRNARLDFRQTEWTHCMENAIYNELRQRGWNVDIGVLESIEKNKDNKSVRKTFEVDFVCNKGSKRCYVQSAYRLPNEEKIQQELRPFKKIKDSFQKIIVIEEPIIKYKNEDGILFINIFDFLLNSDL